MSLKKIIIFLSIFFVFLISPSVSAQVDSLKIAEFNDWNFKISPFLWYVGINGTIKSPPSPSQLPEFTPPEFDIDISFRELRNSLKFFIMIAGEYNNDRLVVLFGNTTMILEGEAVTPLDLLLQDVNYRFTYAASELSGGYRLIYHDKIDLDVLLGLRMVYTAIKASSRVIGTTFTGERDVFWYDPILGFRFTYIPHYRLMLGAYVDFGPIRSIDSYQVFGQAQYLFSRVFSLSLGYRQYFVNTRNDDSVFKGSMYGPYLKFGFRF